MVRLDRLARSLRHLIEILERLERRGAGFRSLGDPIDTTTPQGMFVTQILGAVAQFERALIRERTRAGMKTAALRGGWRAIRGSASATRRRSKLRRAPAT